MKRSSVLLPGLCAIALLSGCASTGDARVQSQSLREGDPVTDHAYIAQVEATARRRNVQVIWVNPPTTRHRHSRSP